MLFETITIITRQDNKALVYFVLQTINLLLTHKYIQRPDTSTLLRNPVIVGKVCGAVFVSSDLLIIYTAVRATSNVLSFKHAYACALASKLWSSTLILRSFQLKLVNKAMQFDVAQHAHYGLAQTLHNPA